MENNISNSTEKENNKSHPSKSLVWLLIILIIIGVGFLIYKKYSQKKYTFEEKMQILESLNNYEDTLSREEKIEILENLETESEQETYSNQDKLDILKNL